MVKRWWALAAAATLGFAVSGCAEAPSAEPQGSASPAASQSSSSEGKDAAFKACMVSDAGGFDDKSFNQTSYKGLEDAVAELGIQSGKVESTNQADFAKNIQSMVDAKCSIVVSVGFMLADATIAAAKANPEVSFAIVDFNDPAKLKDLKNLKPLVFNTAESSFLAGYLAASQTKTGKVGTFGGMKIPTVTVFMDGFAQGVAQHNKDKGTKVTVLGWDPKQPDKGQFVAPPNPFENVQGGKQTAKNLTSQGADILFPVAGPAGEGALQVAQESKGKVNAIWVDTDGCESTAKYCATLLTSVRKGMDVAVADAIKSAHASKFSNEVYVGTLENGGTGLAPFHDFDAKISDETKSELEALKADIIAGKLKITSASQPKA